PWSYLRMAIIPYIAKTVNLFLHSSLDSDIFKYIDMPAGTRLIRISPDAFEADKNDKEIYMMKSSR
ncbi:MAG: hypothetical protein K1W38_04595, partial [Lachnospiraceae bacterium]